MRASGSLQATRRGRGGYEITLEQLDRQARYDHTVSARLDALELDALSERVMASDDDVRLILSIWSR